MPSKINVTSHKFLYTRGHVAQSSSKILTHQNDNKNSYVANILCSLTFKVFQKHTFFSHKTFATTIAETSRRRNGLSPKRRRRTVLDRWMLLFWKLSLREISEITVISISRGQCLVLSKTENCQKPSMTISWKLTRVLVKCELQSFISNRYFQFSPYSFNNHFHRSVLHIACNKQWDLGPRAFNYLFYYVSFCVYCAKTSRHTVFLLQTDISSNILFKIFWKGIVRKT